MGTTGDVGERLFILTHVLFIFITSTNGTLKKKSEFPTRRVRGLHGKPPLEPFKKVHQATKKKKQQNSPCPPFVWLQDSHPPAAQIQSVAWPSVPRGGRRSEGERRQLREAESYSEVIACFELAILCSATHTAGPRRDTSPGASKQQVRRQERGEAGRGAGVERVGQGFGRCLAGRETNRRPAGVSGLDSLRR